MNKEILAKVDEIIGFIEESKEYQKYLLLKKELEKNQKVKELTNDIKRLQKEIVHGNNKELELEEKMQSLNSIPLYREYNNTLSEINNTFSIIENTLNNYFDKI